MCRGAATSTTSKIIITVFLTKVGVYFVNFVLGCIFGNILYLLSKLHLYRCRKHSFIVIFTPMKLNDSVKFTVFDSQITVFMTVD